ncbi:hypothetical protein [Flavobacterium sp.]|uniref:hypothetical protein n=1 Tax=Flavobacterium sp. TaxID=239 RepID=UPI0025B81F5C|nr:hypothetical protein [Flavobacterium sp.]
MRILLLLAFVFASTGIWAQTAKGTKNGAAVAQSETSTKAILHVDQFLSALQSKSGGDSQVRSLLYEPQSAVYVETGNVKTYGENPVCLFTDVRSLSSLGTLNLPKTIELVSVKVKNLGELSGLNLASLSAFPRLQYVYIVSEVETQGPKIVAAVKDNDPRYSVFYNILSLK